MDNWVIDIPDDTDRSNFEPLFNFVLRFFKRIFGAKLMAAEKCIITHAPLCSKAPWLVTSANPIRVELKCLPDNPDDKTYNWTLDWSNIVFQLGHELTHYAIRQAKKDKDLYLYWFEEILCEAMALVILKLASEEWTSCTLSRREGADKYWASICSYYLKVYNKESNISKLKDCSTLEKLQALEKKWTKQLPPRPKCNIERNYLVDTFLSMRGEIKNVVKYTMYMRGLPIDFDRWCEDKPHSKLVSCLRTIQPVSA